MKKIMVGLLLILGVSAFIAQAEPISMTGIAFANAQKPTYWHLGKEAGGKMIAEANIPFEPEKMMPFQGKMVKVTGALIPDRTTPTFDRGYTVEAVVETP
jgi:hypothetical protein